MTNEPNAAEATAPEKVKPGMGVVKAYLAVYAVLFLGYVTFLLTGKEAINGQAFINRAFPGTGEMETRFDEKNGHLRMWSDLTFSARHGDAMVRHRIPEGEILTRNEAIILAGTIVDNPDEVKEIVIYKSGFLCKVPWPYMMTIYNIFGMFMLLIVFLRQPLGGALDESARKTRESLAAAEQARVEAQELKKRYENLVAEIEAEQRRMDENAKVEFVEEQARILQTARHEAAGIIESMKSSLDAEVAIQAKKLKARVAGEALAAAREAILREVGKADHDAAVDAFVADVKKVRLS
jgi:F-type H+-transporting ATPase subunit b